MRPGATALVPKRSLKVKPNLGLTINMGSVRHKLEWFLFVFLFFCACCSRTENGYYLYWITIAAIWFVMIIFDYLFLNEGAFNYEPNYKYWEKLNDPKY
jgi:hypothetical protein